jgi:WD40 repeat protein
MTAQDLVSRLAEDPAIAIQQGHLAQVSSVAFAAAGQKLISASIDGTVRIWDVQSVRLVKVLRATIHPIHLPLLATSPNGDLLAFNDRAEGIGIWDVKTGSRLAACEYPFATQFAFGPYSMLVVAGANKVVFCNWRETGHDKEVDLERTLLSFAISKDGSVLATGTEDYEVQLWNTATGEELKTLHGHTDAVISVAFSPKDNFLATASADKTVRIWNLNTAGARLLTTESSSVLGVSFSSDGKRLLTKNANGEIKVWEVETGALSGSLSVGIFSGVASFSPDGRFVGVGNSRAVTSLDLTTQEMRVLRLSQLHSLNVAFDPKSTLLAVGDGPDPTIWDLKTGILRSRFGRHTRRFRSLGLSGDGLELAAADSNLIALWNLGTMQMHAIPDSSTRSGALLIWSPEGKIIAVHSDKSLFERTVTFWTVKDGRKLLSISDTAGAPISFSHTDRYFADIASDGVVRVSDLDGNEVLHVPNIENVRLLAFSPDDNLLAALIDRHNLRVWKLPEGKTLMDLHPTIAGTSLHFASKNAVLVELNGDRCAEAWNVETGRRSIPPPRPCNTAVRKLIARLSSPNQVDLVDWDSHEVFLRALLPTSEPIVVADWNASREVLSTVSESGEISLWHVDEVDGVQKICSFYMYEDDSSAVLDAEGVLRSTVSCSL